MGQKWLLSTDLLARSRFVVSPSALYSQTTRRRDESRVWEMRKFLPGNAENN